MFRGIAARRCSNGGCGVALGSRRGSVGTLAPLWWWVGAGLLCALSAVGVARLTSTVADDAAPAAAPSRRFNTIRALYAAGEFQASGRHFFSQFFEKGWPTTEEFRSVTHVDSYAIAADTLESLGLYSGLGVPLARTGYARRELERARVAVRGELPDWTRSTAGYVEHRLEVFAKLTGYDSPMAVGFSPVALEFTSGDPNYAQAVDLSNPETRRWDEKRSTPIISPGALGLSIYDAVLFAREALARDREETHIRAKKRFIGTNARDAFCALVLLDSAISKVHALRDSLVYEGDKLGGKRTLFSRRSEGAVRYYFPQFVGVNLSGEEVRFDAKSSGDAGVLSRLFDSAALLLAATELYDFSSALESNSYSRLFAGQDSRSKDKSAQLFRSDTVNLARDLALYEIERMASIHLNTDVKSFFSAGVPGESGSTLIAVDAGLTLLALANAYDKFGGSTALKGKRGQMELFTKHFGEFILNQQSDDGSFYDSYDIRAQTYQNPGRSLASQGLLIRGLLAAYRVTGRDDFKDAALNTLRYLEENRWAPRVGGYSSKHGDKSTGGYSVMDAAALVGALRDLALVTGDVRILYRFGQVFRFFKQRGLQRSESRRGGESSDQSDPDSDLDGVSKDLSPVSGGRHGVAPVLADGLR